MAFQRLNVRAKKSFSGLYSFDNIVNSPTKSTAVCLESSPRSDLTQDTEECDLEDFGAKLERCKGKYSPSKDSPSKRKKLLGSLRSLRSLANLHSSPTKTEQPMTPRLESTKKQQNECMTPSPSLALLNFEQSPPDKPMFDLTIHQRSVSGSSLEVHHSSPVTIPGSVRQTTPYCIFPPVTDLPSGTIPDTPGPMQRAFNRDPTDRAPRRNASPTPMERYAPSTPVLTPLPGTNLSVGDVDPELVPLPPSVNPSSVHLGCSNPGYFDIPVDEQPQMNSTDMLNGIACLKLADQHEGTAGGHPINSTDVMANTPIGRRGTAEEIRLQYEDAKLQDTVRTLGIPEDRMRVPRHMHQVKDLKENTCTLGDPKHYQVLSIRPQRQDEDLHGRTSKGSCISEDWETCSCDPSTAMASQHSLNSRNPYQPCRSSPSSVYSAAVPSEACGETKHNDPPPDLAYIVCNVPRQAPDAENPWGRHTGLYDGSGYGPDSSSPSTPRDPDEGIQEVRSKTSPAPLSVNGGLPGQKTCNDPLASAIAYLVTVQESPCTTHEKRDYDSLESLYRAYTYPYGTRFSSSSDNSIGAGKQMPATKEDNISS